MPTFEQMQEWTVLCLEEKKQLYLPLRFLFHCSVFSSILAAPWLFHLERKKHLVIHACTLFLEF